MKKWYWLILTLADLFFVYFMPREITYYKNTLLVSIFTFSIVLLVSPYLLYKTLSSFYPKKTWPIIVAIGSVLIFGPTFAVYNSYQEETQLLDQGKWATGIIVNKYESSRGRRGQKQWRMIYKFSTVEKGIATGEAIDDKNEYAVGDSLDVFYLPEFPAINRVEFELE